MQRPPDDTLCFGQLDACFPERGLQITKALGRVQRGIHCSPRSAFSLPWLPWPTA